MTRNGWPASVVVLLSTALVSFAAACGGSDSGQDSGTTTTTTTSEVTTQAAPPPESPPPAAGPVLTIENNTFTDLTVPPGAQITVKNLDSAEHSVTSDTQGAFDEDVDGNQQTVLTAPTQPGTYPFHCTYHPNMHGVLTVQ